MFLVDSLIRGNRWADKSVSSRFRGGRKHCSTLRREDAELGPEPALQGYVYSFHFNTIDLPDSAEEFSRVQTRCAAGSFLRPNLCWKSTTEDKDKLQ